jgi:hypothetical protein
MHLVIDRQGHIRGLYDELIELAALGEVQLIRASRVEPDNAGAWWADLGRMHGPRLGPFAKRSLALAAEQAWLVRNWLLTHPGNNQSMPGE